MRQRRVKAACPVQPCWLPWTTGVPRSGTTRAPPTQWRAHVLCVSGVCHCASLHAASMFTLCLARMCSFRPVATAAPSHTCGGQLQSFLDSNSHFSTRATFIRSCCSLVMPGGNLVGKASAAPTSSWMRLLRAKESQGRWVVTTGTTVSRAHKTTHF